MTSIRYGISRDTGYKWRARAGPRGARARGSESRAALLAPRDVARDAVESQRTTIRHACATFALSETCYRYVARYADENAVIAGWLVRLTTAYRTWGFCLCYLHLRNAKQFDWNRKRVYRIHRVLELNLRMKPQQRLVRAPRRSRSRCPTRSIRRGRWISCTINAAMDARFGSST